MKRPPPPLLPDNHLAGSSYHYQAPSVPSHGHIPDQATSFNRGLGYNLSFTKPMPRFDWLTFDFPNIFPRLFHICIHFLIKQLLNYYFLRDTKWDVLLEFNHLNNCNTEYGTLDGNFFKFVPTSSTATLMPPFQTVQHQFPKFENMLPFQVRLKFY